MCAAFIFITYPNPVTVLSYKIVHMNTYCLEML